ILLDDTIDLFLLTRGAAIQAGRLRDAQGSAATCNLRPRSAKQSPRERSGRRCGRRRRSGERGRGGSGSLAIGVAVIALCVGDEFRKGLRRKRRGYYNNGHSATETCDLHDIVEIVELQIVI